jgi:hypothetical protein
VPKSEDGETCITSSHYTNVSTDPLGTAPRITGSAEHTVGTSGLKVKQDCKWCDV